MKPNCKDTTALSHMPRRTFLAFGAASLASTALVGPAARAATHILTDSLPYDAISLGYCLPAAPSAETSDATGAALNGMRVVAADALPCGDATLQRKTPYMEVHGLVLPDAPKKASLLQSLSLDVPFQAVHGNKQREVTFHAWHFQQEPVCNISPATRFPVPLQQEKGITFSLTLRDAQGKTATLQKSLQVHAADHGAKLRTGTYLVGLHRQVEGVPAWNTLCWKSLPNDTTSESNDARLQHRTILSDAIALVDFPYLVFTISA